MTTKEAIVILLDVGNNSLAKSSNDQKSFFDRAKECAKKIIQRKIFARPNDEIGLILLGTEETENDLNRSMQEGYENITEFLPMRQPSWEMVRKVETIEMSDYTSVGWVEGLLVALNFIRDGTIGKKFSSKRIILITNFMVAADESNIDVIKATVQDAEIELLAISDCVEQSKTYEHSEFTPIETQSQALTQCQQSFKEMIDEIGGNLCHINYAEEQLLYFDKKASKSMPWKATLSIGSKFSINVSGYVHVEQSKLLGSFKTGCILPNTETRTFIEHMQENEVVEKPDEADIITGYIYGSKIVTPDGDNEIVHPDEQKGLFGLAFFKNDRIHKEFLTGEKSHLLVAQRECPKSVKLFQYLVEKMAQMSQIMVAKKVYNARSKAVNVALIPVIDDTDIAKLKMIEIVYANELRMLNFPSLRTNKTKPSADQESAIDKLVDLMSLSEDEKNEQNLFDYNQVMNPANQHLARCVAYRALNPTEPLPSFKEDLAATIDIPAPIKERIGDIVKKCEELFPLEYAEVKQRKKVFGRRDENDQDDIMMAGDDTDDVDESDSSRNIIAVGTVDPVGDFGILLKRGHRFADLAEQMQTIIYDLMFRAADLQPQKITECILHFREMSKLHSPFSYNKWMENMKVKLLAEHGKVIDEEEKKVDVNLWQFFIVKENMGLISQAESAMSNITDEDQKNFYVSKDRVLRDEDQDDEMDEDALDAMLE